MSDYLEISDLVGKTFKDVKKKSEQIHFILNDGSEYIMLHDQECCEYVYIEDICGDLNDLIGEPIIQADEDTNSDNPPEDCDESFMWTFYNIATRKGHVTIRWLGQSNGYYSESVDLKFKEAK